MPGKSRHQSAAAILYAAVAVLFTVFFLYLSLCEGTNVYKTRDTHAGITVKDAVMTEIRDESARCYSSFRS